jgi:hypothetical protein
MSRISPDMASGHSVDESALSARDAYIEAGED